MEKPPRGSTVSAPIRVFISYARSDGLDIAAGVQAELESDGFEVWRDLRDLDPTTDFSVEIERAIAASDVILVCVTASIARARESFVRREILYAQSKDIPIIPLRIANAEMPILIIQLTWIDAPGTERRAGMLSAEIRRRLQGHGVENRVVARPEASVAFVRGLLDDIVTTLEATTDVLLDIATTGLTTSRPMRGGLPSSMQRLVRNRASVNATPGSIGQELSERHRRIVLHGAAGSGKTTSLLIAAREAANAWIEDRTRRLPVFCRAADWNAANDEALIDWLHRSAPLLPMEELRTAFDSSKITLFIDGLDELGAWVRRERDGAEVIVDPRADLIGRIPADVGVLVTARSDVLSALGELAGFERVEMEPITEDQVASFVSHVPNLARLLSHDDELRAMARTPLTLGLLAFVVSHRGIDSATPEAQELNPRLRLIHDFTVSRWQHENAKSDGLIQTQTLLGVLGRLATWGARFTAGDIDEAAKPEDTDGAVVRRLALQLGLIRASDERSHEFFHPSFADCYATIHCRKYLGAQVPDGWDSRLFFRIAQLNDPSFVPTLKNMVTGFWRGEFGDEVAMALSTLGDPNDEEVVRGLLRLTEGAGLGRGDWIHRFVERADEGVRRQFVATMKEAAAESVEVVHQLVLLGPLGVAALVDLYHGLNPQDPMRGQIASYTAVKKLL